MVQRQCSPVDYKRAESTKLSPVLINREVVISNIHWSAGELVEPTGQYRDLGAVLVLLKKMYGTLVELVSNYNIAELSIPLSFVFNVLCACYTKAEAKLNSAIL